MDRANENDPLELERVYSLFTAVRKIEKQQALTCLRYPGGGKPQNHETQNHETGRKSKTELSNFILRRCSSYSQLGTKLETFSKLQYQELENVIGKVSISSHDLMQVDQQQTLQHCKV